MSAGGDILGLEVTVGDGEFEALTGARLARRGVLGDRRRASEAIFDLASRRTTIAGHQVSIVAIFTWIEVSVAADRGTGLGLARAVLAVRLLRAGLGAARIVGVAVEEAVHRLASAYLQRSRIGAAVAQLVLLHNPVTTLGHLASPSRRRTVSAGLDLAGAGTAIAARRVAVIALLALEYLAVAALGHAGLADHPTLVSWLDRLAVARAAIAARCVAVVALFVAFENAIAALHSGADAKLPRCALATLTLHLAVR